MGLHAASCLKQKMNHRTGGPFRFLRLQFSDYVSMLALPQTSPWKATDDRPLCKVTDSHCHPTDLPFSTTQARNVGLGGLAAMATRIHDQSLVESFGETYVNGKETSDVAAASTEVVACFGTSLKPHASEFMASMRLTYCQARLPSLVLPSTQCQHFTRPSE